jgi:hypothetical protein
LQESELEIETARAGAGSVDRLGRLSRGSAALSTDRKSKRDSLRPDMEDDMGGFQEDEPPFLDDDFGLEADMQVSPVQSTSR